MEAEFGALAEQVANEIPEVLGSIVVSIEGKAVGAFPAHALDLLEPHAVKLSRLPEAKRSFLEFGGSSLFSVSRPLHTVVIVTPQSVDADAVLDAFEATLDRLEAASSQAAAVLEPLEAPELVASNGSGDATPKDSHEAVRDEPSEDQDDQVGLAQQFSSLLQENFGDVPESETSEAEAAS